MGKPFKRIGSSIASGLRKVGDWGEDFYDSEIGRALTYAAIAAAAVYTGGAALGAIGAGGTGALATGATATGGALTSGTAMGVAGMAGASAGAQSAATEKAEMKQEAAEAKARHDAQVAARESEILRKQALLASEKSMTARRAQAGSISNRLRDTRGTLLGDEEEKLGG